MASRRALVWRALLGAGAISNRAALARWQGVSRARVTQVMRLLPGRRRAPDFLKSPMGLEFPHAQASS